MKQDLPQLHTVIGVLAHVDAGKTTLSEALLYKTGVLRSLGRVDHKDAFLDTDRQERQRGITIFSKQAQLQVPYGESSLQIQWVDTPGHMDFSAEMERTLSVLDYAVLVVSGTDGVQAHTETLWELLERYHIPTWIWVNKMDAAQQTPGELLEHLQKRLSGGCTAFGGELPCEAMAMESEDAMEEYLQAERLSKETVQRLIRLRRVFPVYFGSALKVEGVDALLQGLGTYCVPKVYPKDFGARVYKITHDEQGNRLTWLKVTGGTLAVRSLLPYADQSKEALEEKVTQIRVYSGAKFTTCEQAEAGAVCAVMGLSATYAGQGLGRERDSEAPVLEPVMTYGVHLPQEVDPQTAFAKLSLLAEEDPLLRIHWDPQLKEIQLQIMGDVQIEILQQQILDRFGWSVSMGTGKILYKETLAAPTLGAGHFEPLRHYAEVHLLLEPLPRGTGIVLESACSTDTLAVNWQRLILTHLAERTHLGVLTGSPLTDVRITVMAGRAHEKHTEGGDFRQASYRAVRQGLMKGESVLLEPFYAFRLEVPAEAIGRAINDLKAMGATFENPRDLGGAFVLTGKGPASCLQRYRSELIGYTHGTGHLSTHFDGYYPCHNTKEVVEAIGYEADRDVEHTADSVFCSHGAGLTVKWDKADAFMHLDSGVRLEGQREIVTAPKVRARNLDFDEKELEAIMEREFGPIKRPRYSTAADLQRNETAYGKPVARQDHLIVDGYNMIFAWEELKALAQEGIAFARDRLKDRLANYAAFLGCDLILVFDGYKVQDNPGSVETENGIRVVYTKEGETADAYIEKLVTDLGKDAAVHVATSDALIQLTALRMGTLRMSARELETELQRADKEIHKILEKQPKHRVTIGDFMIK